jgi:chromate transporter
MPTENSPLKRPNSKMELFIGFTLLALQGVGGVLAVAQQELVERRQWMSRAQFLEEWSVAQILPGPNIVNLALMLGRQYFGIYGALAAVAGLLVAPLILVLLMAILFGGVADNPVAQGALKGMGAVSAGLIIATGLKLSTAFKQNPLGLNVAWLLVLATFVSVGLFRLPLLWVLSAIGLIGCWLAYRSLLKTDAMTKADSGVSSGSSSGTDAT